MRLVDGHSAAGSGYRLEGRPASSGKIERAFTALLQEHPDASVAAVSTEGPKGLLPLPDSLPVAPGVHRLTDPSLIDLISMPDRVLVAQLWWQAQVAGVSSGSVRLVQDDPTRAMLTFFDLRDRHGALIVVVVIGAAETDVIEWEPGDGFTGPSRYARMTKDGTARILDVDDGFERMMGYTRAELVGRRIVEFIHPDDLPAAIEQWMRMCDFPGPSRPIRLRHRAADGRWLCLEVTNFNRLDDPDHHDVLADMVDISEEVAAQEAVRARQQLLEQVTATVPIGLLHADVEGQLLYTNDRLTELTGLAPGMLLAYWPGVATPHHQSMVNTALSAAVEGSPTDTLVEAIDQLGEVRHLSLSVRPLLDPLGAVTGVTGSVEDVTASVAERRELEVRAATDPLTGCLNRSATLAVIQDALDGLDVDGTGSGPEPGDGVAVIFLDVDNLKEVNDRLGHSAGDSLLVEVASRLRAAVRRRDTVGRFGGDEFVLLAGHVPNPERAMTVAQWVASRVTRPFIVEGDRVQIRASLGVAWTAGRGVQAAWLVSEADTAMYRSKRDGRCEPVLAGWTPGEPPDCA